MRKRMSLLMCVLGTVTVFSGCTSSGEPQAEKASTLGPSAKRQAFDPPRTFDLAKPVPMPESAWEGKISLGGERLGPLPVLLLGTRAYVTPPDRVELVDVDHGTVTDTIRPQHEPALSAEGFAASAIAQLAAPPVLTDLQGKPRVVTAFATSVRGQGTTPSRPIVEVLAVDADTGGAAERVEFDAGNVEPYTQREQPVVLGAHAGTVVLRIGTDTVAVDLGTRRELWRRTNFATGAVAGDTVIGADPRTGIESDTARSTVRGLAVDSGQERWRSNPYRSATVSAASPKVVTVTGVATDGKQLFQVLEAATGRVLDTSVASGRVPYRVQCSYDGTAITVCHSDDPQRWAGAFDDSGTWLWELPDTKSNRVAPTVTTAWHGAVYGYTTNGPLVLDARTGADREPHPGVAPWLVNEYVAVASAPGGGTDVGLYRAAS